MQDPDSYDFKFQSSWAIHAVDITISVLKKQPRTQSWTKYNLEILFYTIKKRIFLIKALNYTRFLWRASSSCTEVKLQYKLTPLCTIRQYKSPAPYCTTTALYHVGPDVRGFALYWGCTIAYPATSGFNRVVEYSPVKVEKSKDDPDQPYVIWIRSSQSRNLGYPWIVQCLGLSSFLHRKTQVKSRCSFACQSWTRCRVDEDNTRRELYQSKLDDPEAYIRGLIGT